MLICPIVSAIVRERARVSWLTEEAEAVIYYHNIYKQNTKTITISKTINY